MAAPTPPLAALLARLQAAGLAEDTTQLLDALWLACHLPGPAPSAAPGVDAPAAPPQPDAGKPTAPRPTPAPAAAPAGAGEVDITLPRPAGASPAPATQGVYAHAGPAAGEEALRARAIRVAGVPALRDGPALARALRPLGKRRRSRTRFLLDEAATVERYADTGMLLPVLAGERERFFAVTLLVEDSPALPLWRGLADELEALLARQGGFRSFRRLALASVQGKLHLRSRSGALHPPRMLLDDDRSLVLIATDGTTDAWADGRMTALGAELGRRTALAVLQWMPERLWPHTALGGADLRVQAPRAGAPLADLKVTRPRWLHPREPVLPMPLAALTPAALGRLAAMLMAKPDARAPAGLLWPAPPDPGHAEAATPPDELADLDPAQRIDRFRGVASARVLQAAVHLSAAAPLTLPVVRLVHRVMQPGAPAEDLPLLLLGGLLERGAPAAAPVADDNDVVFDFPPGVRQALQASLLKHEADAVRRAVSTYIAERSGSPVDFAALLLDPDGPLRLPAWARPFAEVNRQVQALFMPPPAAMPAPDEPPLRLRERAWAPGVTVQAEVALATPALQLAWSPSGERLALRQASGIVPFAVSRQADGRHALTRSALPLRHPVDMLIVKGFDVPEAATEALVQALRERFGAYFQQPLTLTFHTVKSPPRSGRAQIEAEVRALASVMRNRVSLLCCIGGPAFFESPWMAAVHSPYSTFEVGAADLQAVLVEHRPASRWQVSTLQANGPVHVLPDAHAAAAAEAVLAMLAEHPGLLPRNAYGAGLAAIAWAEDDTLLLADTKARAVLREHDATVHTTLPDTWASRPSPLAMARQPGASQLSLAQADDLRVDLPGYASLQMNADGLEVPVMDMAWSASGSHLALWLANGTLRFLWADEKPSDDSELDDLHHVSCPPAWGQSQDVLAAAMEDGHLLVRQGQQVLARWSVEDEVTSIAWSHDDALLAVGLHSGAIELVRGATRGTAQVVPVPAPDDGALRPLLAFAPRRLDAAHDTLAVACGNRLTLLRIDARQLQAGGPVSEPQEPAETYAEPDEVAGAAWQVLQSLALTFGQGGFLADASDAGLPTAERYARRMGFGPGMPGRATLEVLLALCDPSVTQQIGQVLEGEVDSLAYPDTHAGASRWQQSTGALAEGLHAWMQAGRPDDAQARAVIAGLQAWLLSCEAVFEDLPAEDLQALAQLIGTEPQAWLASLAPLRQPGIRGDDRALQRLADRLPALQAPPATELLAASVARTAWLHADRGASHFSGCRRMHELVDRMAGVLAQAAETLFDKLPATPPLVVTAPVPAGQLAIVDALASPLGLAIQPGAGGDTVWTMSPADVAPLVRLLGAIVASRLAWHSHLPPLERWAVPGPLLLWVDDRPANNLGAVRRLQQHGFRVRTALDTASAMALLRSELPVAAVISDMGRPPDEQAGYTLLAEMQHFSHSQPYIIYSRDPRPEHREEAVRRGALGTTDDFEEALRWLRRAFLLRPAIKRAA